jgi:hypothetical protein
MRTELEIIKNQDYGSNNKIEKKLKFDKKIKSIKIKLRNQNIDGQI